MKDIHQFTDKELLLSQSTIASDNVALPIDSLAQTITYTGANITSISVTYRGNVYIQTITYTGDNITGISQWVKQ